MSKPSELEIRKGLISDESWEKTSSSWKELKPFRNFNGYDASDETEEEFFERLKPKYIIPLEVLQQWIYPLYYDPNTVNNYGWIDYTHIEFTKVLFTIEQLLELHVVEKYQDYVDVKKSYQPYSGFPCIERDLKHWQEHNTWTVPPVVLDVNSFDTIPSDVENVGPYQLIEGHTRLGLLLAMQRVGILEKNEHQVYLLSHKAEK